MENPYQSPAAKSKLPDAASDNQAIVPLTKVNAESILSIQHVTKRFPGVIALADVSLDIVPGELHAIVGENGAGKSTLMKILSGVITDFEGELLVRGQAGALLGHARRRSGRHQHHSSGAEPRRTAFGRGQYLPGPRDTQRLALARSSGRWSRRPANCCASWNATLTRGNWPAALRVGDQQLIEIAKALSLASDILIMDEPTSALTETEVARLYRVIERLRAAA